MKHNIMNDIDSCSVLVIGDSDGHIDDKAIAIRCSRLKSASYRYTIVLTLGEPSWTSPWKPWNLHQFCAKPAPSWVVYIRYGRL